MANSDSTIQIIPFYSQPYVHTVIVDNTQYDETVDTSTTDEATLPYSTVVVIGADSGIDNKFVRLTDINTKKKLFGEGNYTKYGQPSLQADALFNGYTNVWLMRVLPDNATYANQIILAHVRKGKILDELNQETGKHRLEIKFSSVPVTPEQLGGGAVNLADIKKYAATLENMTADPLTGYMTLPIYIVSSVGRGNYGNNYSMALSRDTSAEKEYQRKMYKFSLLNNFSVTKISNEFSGSFVAGSHNNASTLIDDVIDQYTEGSCPVNISVFDTSIEEIYKFYMSIVAENKTYLNESNSSAEERAIAAQAEEITLEQFDPMFGLVYNTRADEQIPYYRNYTVKSTGVWVKPALEIPGNQGANKPLNMRDWSSAFVGARVLVAADPMHDGRRWMYHVISIDSESGNIQYDEGEETAIDEDQYDGINISSSVGVPLAGGSDGDFEEITVNGVKRKPSAEEMKLLLSREYVKAFRGQKDRRILSPSRINLDFIFDANYNLTTDETLDIENANIPIYGTNTVLTDHNSEVLSVLASSNIIQVSYTDLNVKQAMYDLNEFRNRNGMKMNMDAGAGCHLYLDCGFVGSKELTVNYELQNILNSVEAFSGRQTSVDFGYYQIFDPATSKRINVTVDYFIASHLVDHIIRNGLNTPFTYEYAQLAAIQRDNSMVVSGDMIRDSFMPDIDDIDWDVKEKLYKARINYWVVSEEGRYVQRACQNTRQTEASALLEENNVRVLNTLKKGLEKACRGYLYKWNEPSVRKGYTDAQMRVYRPWIGTMVEDLDIYFTANEWEQNRMIMHCYVSVKFRDIIKRIILEINIQRPTYTEETAE